MLPEFELQEVHEILRQKYDINASLMRLNGERDLNFLVDNVSGDTNRYVLKISNQEESSALLEFQGKVMERLAASDGIESIRPHLSNRGRSLECITSKNDSLHFCRMTTYLEGDLFSSISPRSTELLGSLGSTVAKFGLCVADLDATPLERPLLWRMEQALLVTDGMGSLIATKNHKDLVSRTRALFVQDVLPLVDHLPRGIIHNDANDNNIVVKDAAPWLQTVKGLIDFGDMVYGWKVTDLAVACAYAMLKESQPLDVAVQIIKGYHEVSPLHEEELAALFPLILMRLAMSVCNSARQKRVEPDNQYLSISERPAWEMLERLSLLSPRYAHYLFRGGCGLSPVPHSNHVASWLKGQSHYSPVCSLPDSVDEMLLLDTSVSSPYLENYREGEYDVLKMQRSLERALEDTGALVGIGRYNEYRLIYQSEDFNDATGHRRTLHLGIDIFQPAGSPVYCPLGAEVFSIADHGAAFDYGGTVILKHSFYTGDHQEFEFYTLYGHLSFQSTRHLKIGQKVYAGEILGQMGTPEENGNWPPHVHFQIVTDMLDEANTFVGVGSHAHRDLWRALCLNPNLILRLPDRFLNQPLSDQATEPKALHENRIRCIPDTLSLSYRQPISVSRGVGQYLYDFAGTQFLDAVNNVPHVGHCHPYVVKAEKAAAGVLNTNTRYLYRGLGDYAERLLKNSPKNMGKVFLVNSGSEANDLALRMARCHTRRSDMVVLEHGYHGNLSSLIDVSSYKHDGPGGNGPPDWVHTLEAPGVYGASSNAHTVHSLFEEDPLLGRLAGFICEAIPGCGGQLVLPDGYLELVYSYVRASGGICIADEVQTGFGRVGSHFWAFELQGVEPDIITFGKPAGNGHPLGGVITTNAIAESFTNGMEYFNTFGGNPVSCAIGNAVLDVLELENLQQHALCTGNHLMSNLESLAKTYSLVGEVRGSGLFVGVELVQNLHTSEPAARQASYIAERMKQERVLISTDGPHNNVLKIKPPMVFTGQDADILTDKLEMILSEKWAQPN